MAATFLPPIIVLENVRQISSFPMMATGPHEKVDVEEMSLREIGTLQAVIVKCLLDLGYQTRVGVVSHLCLHGKGELGLY